MDPNSVSVDQIKNGQIAALNELCTMLCIADETYIRSFNLNKFIPPLLSLLSSKSNKYSLEDIEVMTLATRCIALTLDVVPRSWSIVIKLGAVPTLVNCIKDNKANLNDASFAEELLKCLQYLSVEDAKSLTESAGFVTALLECLNVVNDRLKVDALKIMSNLFRKLHSHQASFVNNLVPALVERIGDASDEEVRYICDCIAHIVDRLCSSQALSTFTTKETISQLVSAIQTSPRNQIPIIKLLGLICTVYPDISNLLHKAGILPVLCVILSSHEASSLLDVSVKSLKEKDKTLYSIFFLLNAMVPNIPSENIIHIVKKPQHQWYWEDDFHNWNPYDSLSCDTIEHHYSKREKSMNIRILNNNYRIDLLQMKQYNTSSNLMRNMSRDPLPYDYIRPNAKDQVIRPTSTSPSSLSSPAMHKSSNSKSKTKKGHSKKSYASDLFASPQSTDDINDVLRLFKKQKVDDEISSSTNSPSNRTIPSSSSSIETNKPQISSNISQDMVNDCFLSMLKPLIQLCSHANILIRQDAVEFLTKLFYFSNPEICSRNVDAPTLSQLLIKLLSSRNDEIIVSNVLFIIDHLLLTSPDAALYKNILFREGLYNQVREICDLKKDSQILSQISCSFLKKHFPSEDNGQDLSPQEQLLNTMCNQMQQSIDKEYDLTELRDIFKDECTVATFEVIKSGFCGILINYIASHGNRDLQWSKLKNLTHTLKSDSTTMKNLVKVLNSALSFNEDFQIVPADLPSDLAPGFNSEKDLKQFSRDVPVSFKKGVVSSSDDKLKDIAGKTGIKMNTLVSVKAISEFVKRLVIDSSNEGDLEIEILYDGNVLSPNSTLYEAISRKVHANGAPFSKAFDTSCVLEYRKKKKESIQEGGVISLGDDQTVLFHEYIDHNVSDAISQQNQSLLALMRLIFFINNTHDKILAEDVKESKPIIPNDLFINSQLSSKLVYQLCSPLALVLACRKSLPEWSKVLVQSFPFLFSFEARRFYFYFSTIGASRTIHHETGSNAKSTPTKLTRDKTEKIKIKDRSMIMKEADVILKNHGGNKSVLEFEYEGEVGVGLGPTLEFYNLVSKELQKKDYNLWRDVSSESDNQYIQGISGMFPALLPRDKLKRIQALSLYEMTGRLVAKALEDNRLLDIKFAPPFLALLNDKTPILDQHSYAQIDTFIDSSLRTLLFISKKIEELGKSSEQEKVRSWKQLSEKIDEMYLDFTICGYELVPKGNEISVTIDNYESYIQKLKEFLFRDSFSQQVRAFRKGFSEIIPSHALGMFNPSELDLLISGNSSLWSSREELEDNINCAHGYSKDSEPIQYLIDALLLLNVEDQRFFLEFTTGSSRLPVGGLKNLSPRLTVVKQGPQSSIEGSPHDAIDKMLPSCNTCFHYLKLPPYSSKDVTRQRLLFAIRHGRGSFQLS